MKAAVSTRDGAAGWKQALFREPSKRTIVSVTLKPELIKEIDRRLLPGTSRSRFIETSMAKYLDLEDRLRELS